MSIFVYFQIQQIHIACHHPHPLQHQHQLYQPLQALVPLALPKTLMEVIIHHLQPLLLILTVILLLVLVLLQVQVRIECENHTCIPEFLIHFEAWAKLAQQWLVCAPLAIHNGVETASHAGHCPINLVNVRKIETELYTKDEETRTRVMKIGQNVR